MAHPGSRRALRRHHRARVIRNRVRQYAFTLGGAGLHVEPGRLAWAPVSRWCSCSLCSVARTPRRHLPSHWWEDDGAETAPTRAAGARAARLQ